MYGGIIMKIKKSFKKSISIILTILMIVSTMLVAVTSVSASNITSDGTQYLYFNGSPSTNASNWAKDGTTVLKLNAYFIKPDKSTGEWSDQATLVSGNYYAVKIPSGTWGYVVLVRHNPANTNIQTFDSNWGQTGDLSLSTVDNYISKFDYKDFTSDTTWGDYAAPANSVSATMTGAGVLGGSGTSGNPYILQQGSTVTVNATSAKNKLNDTNLKYKYSFNSTSSFGTSTSKTFSASTVSTSNQSYKVYARSYYDTYTNSTNADTTIYYKVQAKINSYKVTTPGTVTGGKVTVNGTTATSATVEEGKTYTIYVTPNDGYEISTFTVAGADQKSKLQLYSDGSYRYTGTMGSSDVSVNATFAKTATAGKYIITAAEDEKGTLSFSVPNKAEGTADENDTVTVNVTPASIYDCTGITVTGEDGAVIDTLGSGNKYTFTMPAQNVTVSANFAINKLNYIKSLNETGLWLDVDPDRTDTISTLIKWSSYKGTNHSTDTNVGQTVYTFYVPKNVDLSNATIYNGYINSVTISGTAISAKSSAVVDLSSHVNGGLFTITSGVSGICRVMQGSTDAMFLYTTTTDEKGTKPYDLPTKINDERIPYNDSQKQKPSKDSIKATGGNVVTMSNDSEVAKFSDTLALSQVKGRGNSSWEASTKIFGKYAYNMKLDEKTSLFGMDKSKSWCLLANNVDETRLHNALTNQLADDIGLYNSPEYRFVDIYDNGVYLGQYLITEKVDVGSSKLVKGESIDDINESALAEVDPSAAINKTTSSGSYSYNDSTYPMQYAVVSDNSSFDPNFKEGYVDPDGVNSYDPGTYLLEFEIEERYTAEASWFTSPKGQHVVVKSPEYATREEVEYIAKKFAEMEADVFTSNATLSTLSKHMDVDSFARMYLIQELSSNLDSAATSYYLTFDLSVGEDNARFVASPVWDYDWAYGQYIKNTKEAVGGGILDTDNPTAWFAKNKKMGDNQANQYSIQSKLCQNENFNSVVKKVWNGSATKDGFYKILQTYYQSGGKLDQWKNQISKSIDMDETRWGFIKNEPSEIVSSSDDKNSNGWGSKNTANDLDGAVEYLKNTWLKARANWLNTEINKYNNYTPITTPTIEAVDAEGSSLPSEVEKGTAYVIKVTSESNEAFVTYELYDNGKKVDSNDTGIFTISNAESGTHEYTVKAVYSNNGTETEKSSTKVTVVVKNDEKPTDPTDPTVPTDPTDPTDTQPTQPEGEKLNGVKIRFKGTTLKTYAVKFSFDGADPQDMTQVSKSDNGYIGTYYTGAYRFYWYEVTLPEVTVGNSYTLRFTTEKSNMDASTTIDFSKCPKDKIIYYGVDDMVDGTTLTDITTNATAKECFRSVQNMFTNVDDWFDPVPAKAMATTVNADGTTTQKAYQIGDVDNSNTVNIKDVTKLQLSIAELTDDTNNIEVFGDFDIDGDVNVRDATKIQMYVAKINYSFK